MLRYRSLIRFAQSRGIPLSTKLRCSRRSLPIFIGVFRMTGTQIKPDTVWRNNKRGTLYCVWCNAVDSSNRGFIVYQVIEKLNKCNMPIVFSRSGVAVKHSETLKIGVLNKDLIDSQTGDLQWFISWTNRQDERFQAWARPIELWHEKFTEVIDNVSN